jgi:hypothetical protein
VKICVLEVRGCKLKKLSLAKLGEVAGIDTSRLARQHNRILVAYPRIKERLLLRAFVDSRFVVQDEMDDSSQSFTYFTSEDFTSHRHPINL